jgi:hypothetical protein
MGKTYSCSAIIVCVESYDVHHPDPSPLARAAAVRSAREQDHRTRDDSLRLSMSERLALGFELSRAAARMRGIARRPLRVGRG